MKHLLSRLEALKKRSLSSGQRLELRLYEMNKRGDITNMVDVVRVSDTARPILSAYQPSALDNPKLRIPTQRDIEYQNAVNMLIPFAAAHATQHATGDGKEHYDNDWDRRYHEFMDEQCTKLRIRTQSWQLTGYTQPKAKRRIKS